jgi:hypothetical protein
VGGAVVHGAEAASLALRRWLQLTPEQLDVINYGGMLLFKLAIFGA